MCLYPRLIRNRKYTKTKKNGGIIPPIKDSRVLMVPIGCTRCIECKNQKSREWRVRLMEDIKHNKHGHFVTLTFSNEELTKIVLEADKEMKGYELDNWVAKTAVRRFLENWRKETGKSARHWLITEIGHNGTENIHIHGLIWTKDKEMIKRKWKYGFVFIGDYVNERTINYITKYVTKIDEKHKGYNPKMMTSAGIGRGYEKSHNGRGNKFNGKETKEEYTTRQGIKLALPIYYRNKIYNEEEREQLWLQRLDRNERWVCGEKIKGDKWEDYIKTVRYHRKRSERLGYGTNTISWEQEEYERNRRILLTKERIQNHTAAPWQIEAFANATAEEEEESKDNLRWGLSKRNMDMWEEGQYKWKDIWRIEDNEITSQTKTNKNERNSNTKRVRRH